MALVVFTGGARSGKSTAAQHLAQARAADGAAVVVAVFGGTREHDPEFAERVAAHRSARPAAFATLEAAGSLAWTKRVSADSLLIVDCLGTLLGLAMEEAWDACAEGSLGEASALELPAGFESGVEERFGHAVDWLLGRPGDTIVVTNEVGDGVVPQFATGRLFRDVLGRANRRLIDSADSGYLCVAGRLIGLTALPRDAHWPRD